MGIGNTIDSQLPKVLKWERLFFWWHGTHSEETHWDLMSPCIPSPPHIWWLATGKLKTDVNYVYFVRAKFGQKCFWYQKCFIVLLLLLFLEFCLSCYISRTRMSIWKMKQKPRKWSFFLFFFFSSLPLLVK